MWGHQNTKMTPRSLERFHGLGKLRLHWHDRVKVLSDVESSSNNNDPEDKFTLVRQGQGVIRRGTTGSRCCQTCYPVVKISLSATSSRGDYLSSHVFESTGCERHGTPNRRPLCFPGLQFSVVLITQATFSRDVWSYGVM